MCALSDCTNFIVLHKDIIKRCKVRFWTFKFDAAQQESIIREITKLIYCHSVRKGPDVSMCLLSAMSIITKTKAPEARDYRP